MTSPAAPSPRPLPRPLPGLHGYTLLSLLLIVFAGALVIAAPSDVDYWWHLKTGQWIAAHGIPRVDPFSHTAEGRIWIDHEWLQQWLIQALDQRLGYAGPMLLYGAIQAATSLLVWRLIREHGAGRLLALILLLAFFLCAAATWGVRPQIVAALLLAVQLLILGRHRRAPDSRSRRLWWLPLLIGLWANLHGSFLLGLAVIGAHRTGIAFAHLLQDRPLTRLQPLIRVLVAATDPDAYWGSSHQTLASGVSVGTSTAQSLGYALADSPSGQALWIYEKFWKWMDCNGDPLSVLSADEILDNIMLYWLNNSAASSARSLPLATSASRPGS